MRLDPKHLSAPVDMPNFARLLVGHTSAESAYVVDIDPPRETIGGSVTGLLITREKVSDGLHKSQKT
jgi:hypothetical protein